MGCGYSKSIGCYSLKCCCCVVGDAACWWIGALGVVWCGVATLVDFLAAHLPKQYCQGCLDHSLNAKLSLAAGCINAVQWVASLLLLHASTKENKWLLVPWLTWSLVSLAMLVVWVVVTLPYMPSLRGMVSLFQLVWGVHFLIVVRTHYCRLALKFTPPEEAPLTVPPNTPARRHKRRQRRLDPGCQPAIRILLGAALRLHGTFHRGLRKGEKEDDEGEEDEEEEREVVRVVVGGHGDIAQGRDEGEQSCSQRRGRRTMTPAGGKPEGAAEVEASDVVIHEARTRTRYREVAARLWRCCDVPLNSAPPGSQTELSLQPITTHREPQPLPAHWLSIESPALPSSQTEFSTPPRPHTESSAPLCPQTKSPAPPRPQTESSVPLRPKTKSPAPPRPQTESSVPLRPQTKSHAPSRPQTESSVPLRPETKSPDPSHPQAECHAPLHPQTEPFAPSSPQTESPFSPHPHAESPAPTRSQTDLPAVKPPTL